MKIKNQNKNKVTNSNQKISKSKTNVKNQTTRKKAGSNVYYVSQISVDSKEIDFTQKDLEYMDMFRALIEEENARVSEKYQNAVKNKESDAASAKVINEMEDDPEMVLAS